MKKFKVRLRGENFLFNQDGEPRKFGFNALYFVRAETPEAAGKMATIMVRQNPLIKDALTDIDMARPVIRLVEVDKASPFRFLWKKSATKIEFHPED